MNDAKIKAPHKIPDAIIPDAVYALGIIIAYDLWIGMMLALPLGLAVVAY